MKKFKRTLADLTLNKSQTKKRQLLTKVRGGALGWGWPNNR